LALIWPAIVEGVAPVTRLRMAAAEFGWTKLTLALPPTEKLFQSTIAFDELWLMVSVLPAGAPIAHASGADATINALQAEGYIVQINWVNGASKSLPQCTVVNVNNPSSEPPKAGDTVYVDVRCPNHDYDDGEVSIGIGIG